jgi:hypothetical protein
METFAPLKSIPNAPPPPLYYHYLTFVTVKKIVLHLFASGSQPELYTLGPEDCLILRDNSSYYTGTGVPYPDISGTDSKISLLQILALIGSAGRADAGRLIGKRLARALNILLGEKHDQYYDFSEVFTNCPGRDLRCLAACGMHS